MKKSLIYSIALILTALVDVASAATLTVTTAASSGAGSLDAAITALNDGDTIAFSIPGDGPHYITPPVGGFQLITKNDITIDGYTQPGSSVNTSTILASNNASIKIVIKGFDNGTNADRRFTDLTTLGVTGFTDGEEALIAAIGANNFTARGLCFLGDWADGPNNDPVEPMFLSEYAIALGGNATSANAHINGCRFGLDPDGVTVGRLKDGIASFGAGADGLVVGVKAGPANAAAARAQFNVFIGIYIPVILDAFGPTRISGNFFNVYPDGLHEYNVSNRNGDVDHSLEAFFEQNSHATPILIGTDGDGLNDAEERNVFGGVTDCGDRRFLEWYGTAPTSYVIAGNYFGVGVDGVTRFTNGGPNMQLVESFKRPSPVQFGSDFDGVSDAIEANAISWNHPFTTLYPNPLAPNLLDKWRFANIDTGAAGPGGSPQVSVRGNSMIGMDPAPFTYVGRPADAAGRLTGYSNYVSEFMVPIGDYHTFFPTLSSSSTSTRLIGACAPANGGNGYTTLIIDVYAADPEGWANGKSFGLPALTDGGVTRGFAQGRTYLGSFLDNGPFDSNPAAGYFILNISALGLAPGASVTATANYSQSPMGTHNAVTHTSNFADPVTLRAGNIIFVTAVDDGTALNAGAPGTLYRALTNAQAGDTIAFNVPGAGPHYFKPPPNGFPLVYQKHGLTIDGYTQTGSAVNTARITETNNAVIKIVLDARAPNANFRDMAYVCYGTFTVSDPVIDNTSMCPPDGINPERGGFTPSTTGDNIDIPYVAGEIAILGIYRSTDVTVKGLAILGDGSGSEYAIAVALDYGLDTAIKDRFAYDQGSSRGFHIAGCWIGYDPATGAEHLSGAAIAAFRHRDKGTGGTRPELPNMENMTIGVKAGSVNPRAEFNVLGASDLTIAAEGIRYRVAGTQILGPANTEVGRYDDTQVPSVLWGTDGDGVNDAEEGNLFPGTTPTFYSVGNKVFVFAGNTFGLARDGSRPNLGVFAVDEFRFDQRTKVRFGSDFNGISDALEANTVYDTIGFSVNGNAPDNAAWISMRGNSLINNAAMPIDTTLGLNVYNKFIDTTGPNPITPAISTVTTTSLTGTCGLPLPGVAKVVIDVYESDPEGDLAGTPQGKVYRGSFTDNSAADSDSAVGAFTFNIASLGILSGTKVTITANYQRAEGQPTITSVAWGGGSTTLSIGGGTGPFNILRASSVGGPYASFATAAGTPATFADAATMSFYKIGALSGGGQTSPFSTSVTVP